MIVELDVTGPDLPSLRAEVDAQLKALIPPGGPIVSRKIIAFDISAAETIRGVDRAMITTWQATVEVELWEVES